jgi:uncharacterized iron-regulated protein
MRNRINRNSTKAWLALLLFGAGLRGQQPSRLVLPDETTGLDSVVQILVSAFDHVDVVALGENHWRKVDSDLRIALVRNPEFAKKVRFILVEFGSAAQQPTLDRYIRGEDVPLAELQQVWKTTSQGSIWDSPVYADFFTTVRNVNKMLPVDAQIRVLAGDPPTGSPFGRDGFAFSILQEQVLKAHAKALVIYGAGHLLRENGGDPVRRIAKMLDGSYPGQTFVVITTGGPHSESQAFERALKTRERPVLVSLAKAPFRHFVVGAFPGLGITLGQIADACVYFGIGSEVDEEVRPDR